MKRLLIVAIATIFMATTANAEKSGYREYVDYLIAKWSDAMTDCRDINLSDQEHDKRCKETAFIGEQLARLGCFIERSTTWECPESMPSVHQ